MHDTVTLGLWALPAVFLAGAVVDRLLLWFLRPLRAAWEATHNRLRALRALWARRVSKRALTAEVARLREENARLEDKVTAQRTLLIAATKAAVASQSPTR